MAGAFAHNSSTGEIEAGRQKDLQFKVILSTLTKFQANIGQLHDTPFQKNKNTNVKESLVTGYLAEVVE